jgi:hypothetical protein
MLSNGGIFSDFAAMFRLEREQAERSEAMFSDFDAR